MKILWLCNIILPDFSQEFAVKKSPYGGWMTGMLHELEKEEGLDLSLCFPIRDKSRLKEGVCNKHHYYTFLCDLEDEGYDWKMVEDFEAILEKSGPDVVHIWGTEYPHSAAMILACKKRGMLGRVAVNIQGLVSVCQKHYLSGIPEEYRKLKDKNGKTLEDGRDLFKKHGKYEIESLKAVKHVIGRTDWDRACVEAVNPRAQYHFCNEILRDIFYQHAGRWEYEGCQKYSIFVSQASYPVKGFHYLLQALPMIVQKFPDTQVYVAGANVMAEKEGNPYGAYLWSLVEQFGLSRYVNFLDRLDEEEMARQYRLANVFVSPSVIENSPNSLSEARMIGVPTVVSYVGGAYCGMEFNKDGFLYPYHEPALLAYYVCKIFENKEGLCDKFSKCSVEKELRQKCAKATADCNIQIYEEIINISPLDGRQQPGI